MKSTRKQSLGLYFSPTERSFHIVVRLKDVPGALSSVLEILRGHVDLVSSVSYSVENEGAIWSGFGKSISSSDTAESLRRKIEGLPMVIESEVKGSDDGLLIDSFHSGLEVAPNRPAVVFPIVGVGSIYDHLARILGTGGETIMFEEGWALGKSSGDYLNSMLGPGRLEWKLRALLGTYGTIGWGAATLRVEKPGEDFAVQIRECMECSGKGKERKGCNLLRGTLTGAFTTLAGKEFKCEETKCRFAGSPFCEFNLRASAE